MQKYVSFDLGMTVKYRYYTGVIFKAYTYGTGESIVSGGRYDELLGQFGKNATSIGFAINIDNLLAGMARQGIKIETKAVRVMVLFEESGEEEAIALAKELRSQEICAVLFEKEEGMDLDAYSQYAKRNGVREIRYIDSEGRSLCYRLKEEEQA